MIKDTLGFLGKKVFTYMIAPILAINTVVSIGQGAVDAISNEPDGDQSDFHHFIGSSMDHFGENTKFVLGKGCEIVGVCEEGGGVNGKKIGASIVESGRSAFSTAADVVEGAAEEADIELPFDSESACEELREKALNPDCLGR